LILDDVGKLPTLGDEEKQQNMVQKRLDGKELIERKTTMYYKQKR